MTACPSREPTALATQQALTEESARPYTPDQLQRRPPRECQHSRKFKLFAAGGRYLPHRHPTVDMSPMHDWRHNTPKQLRECEANPEMAKYQDPEYRQDLLGRWDEECLRHTRHTKKAFVFGVTRVLGMVGFFLSLFASAVLTILLLFTRGLPSQEELVVMGKVYGTAYVVTLSMWWGIKLLQKIAPNFAAGAQPGPAWELNRRTGEVIVFANPRKASTAWQVGHRLPFHEFDCYLQSTPSHQGLPQFNLSLVHYREEAHVALVGMFGATSSHVEQRAAWDMVQRYMDTSQPLPDTPLWEEFRPLDPTTLAHDQRTGRPTRYWRDMDDETFQQKVHEHQDKLNAFYRS